MRVKGLDLNLLAALDVLLDECNTVKAAERLHLSQPAASAALARLRDYFGDPILTSYGKRMMPTAFALALHQPTKDVLAQVDRLITQTSAFDPLKSDRWFRIGVSDYLSTILFADLVPRLAALAPGIRLDLQPPSDEMLGLLDRGELDLILTPTEHCHPGHPTELLFEEKYVVAGWSGNAVLQKPLSEHDFYAHGHVAVEMGRTSRVTFAETHLKDRGNERKIEIYAASFSLVPELLVGTSRLAIMHERLAKMVRSRGEIVYQPLPFEFPVMKEMVQYHKTRADDPGIKWMVAQIAKCSEKFNQKFK
ncbi:LysR substrate-binding domain-containing protein [Novosphingobium sp. MMS21-SN21R]|uniref:LysR substrate-binding domain-containing protein n=1 Tax=Novosphingobium sp. MMS21-SN21R TaxID=2969298 RepID=UPI002886AFD0|nr:LysR substrate-binding domain-containing protein [Novosphingobium sp. MMS21-SN21R]MDT0510107.1 LysR substrate-binding domain-containing protein [Novosphingobium sp. MMS21-SN21R]